MTPAHQSLTTNERLFEIIKYVIAHRNTIGKKYPLNMGMADSSNRLKLIMAFKMRRLWLINFSVL